jgi:hypothetical protein
VRGRERCLSLVSTLTVGINYSQGRQMMSNFYATNSDLVYLYEVTDPQGVAVWGGEKIEDMFDWHRRSPDSRVFISTWESDEEDAHLVGRPIEITSIIKRSEG